MNLPILSRLKEGVKFDFETLIDNYEQTEQFWDWWWEDRALDEIIRPEIISDDDPILEETANKDEVDLDSYREYFNRFLYNAIATNLITTSGPMSRGDFHGQLLRLICSNSRVLAGEKRVVFAGGGYGSGKTTILRELVDCGKWGLGPGHMVGVDYFKLLVPEFSLIRRVSDGRASLTVQRECKALGDYAFQMLVENGRSFIWDSSMSDADATKAKFDLAVKHGYELSMVAVLTPVKLAIRQAMGRAKESRRFPHPKWLPHSHVEFRKEFNNYTTMFPEVEVFAKLAEMDDPIKVAEKMGGNPLVIADQNALNLGLSIAD